MDYSQIYVNGKWVHTQHQRCFVSIDPSNQEMIAQIGQASIKDAGLAVTSARAAFDHGVWPTLTGKERAHYLRAMAIEIRDRLHELVTLEVKDNGKPYAEAEADIIDAAGCFDYYAHLAESLDENREKEVALSNQSFSSIVRKEPVGVACAIIPWNYPLLMVAWKVAPALAAGCTMILKPAETTSITALELGKIADKIGLPKGVLNIVTGFGTEVGAYLSEHPLIDKIGFTGSVPVGKQIMHAAAGNLKNISLELGGKSSFIIFDDSEIEAAVEWIMVGIFFNQGQVCSATSRVMIHENIYDQVLTRLVEEAKKIKIGNGFEENVKLGPLVNEKQFNAVMAAIEQGKRDGIKLVTGGKRPEGFTKGYYVEPTIFVDVPLQHLLWQNEIFGPVLCVRSFASEEEALTLANDSIYGLAAAVMSTDDERCQRVARKLKAGIVWINCSQPTFTEAPWGGYKQSGIGRELGSWGLDDYLEIKQITRYESDEPWGWYIKSSS